MTLTAIPSYPINPDLRQTVSEKAMGHCVIGYSFIVGGRFQEASAAFKDALALQPRNMFFATLMHVCQHQVDPLHPFLDENTDPEALCRIACLFLKNTAEGQSQDKAIKLLQLSADKGHSLAIEKLKHLLPAVIED